MGRGDGKRRTFGQRIGVAGENAFRDFAHRQGLLATKTEDDFGIDFFCQIDLDPTAPSSAIGDTVVSAFVRASTTRNGRIQLTRSDAHNILRARGCFFVALVWLVKDDHPRVFHRFVDADFAARLRTFLANSTRKKHSLLPTDCRQERLFSSDLSIASEPGFAERTAVELAERGLGAHLPEAAVEVRRTGAGELTLVTTLNFYDYFEQMSAAGQHALYEATFGVPQAQQARLASLAVQQGVIENLEKLPQPLMLAGFVPADNATLEMCTSESSSRCDFIRTDNGQHFGWVQEAGASLTVSRSRLIDGRYVHETRLFLDPSVTTDWDDAPALLEFLAAATESAVVVAPGGFSMDADYFRDLMAVADFTRLWNGARSTPNWPADAVFLRDALDRESHATLQFWHLLQSEPDFVQQLHFLIDMVSDGRSERPASELADSLHSRTARFVLPIVANTANLTLIMQLTCEGRLYEDSEFRLRGIAVDQLVGLELDSRPRVVKSSDRPEVVVHQSWPTLVVGSDSHGLNGAVSDGISDIEIELLE